MRAMVLERADAGTLVLSEREVPIALPGEVLIRVRACGVCRTDLHLVDGELPAVEIPVVPGHEIVGVVEVVGDGVTHLKTGDRAGVPWLGNERSIRSVANFTRADASAFLALAPTIPAKTRVHTYALADANRALTDMREGRIEGAAVVTP